METHTPKKRGRPAKKKNQELPKDFGKIDDTVTIINVDNLVKTAFPGVQPKVVEIIVEKIIEVPKKQLKGYELYKALKDARYPQGGMGNFWENPNGIDKVYVPRPEELYTHFLGDPQAWDKLRDTLALAWLELSMR